MSRPDRAVTIMATVMGTEVWSWKKLTADEAMAVIKVFKQYLLHHGFPGRLSTGGNLAFPFTPPEVAAGTAYRFNAYHIMAVDALEPLFPVEVEDL